VWFLDNIKINKSGRERAIVGTPKNIDHVTHGPAVEIFCDTRMHT